MSLVLTLLLFLLLINFFTNAQSGKSECDTIPVNLNGTWERIDHWWDGNTLRDTLEITQNENIISFYSSDKLVAKAKLCNDSIIVIQGFRGAGINYFTMHSNEYFEKITPLVETVDKIVFKRIKK